MKIALTGGSGFIGTALTRKLIKEGHEVVVYDRIAPKVIDPLVSFVSVNLAENAAPDSLAASDAIVHLAGVSIYDRWTESYKKLILSSRIASTRSIIECCRRANHKPDVFVCASAVGYYGDQGETMLDENGQAGEDFLAGVCKSWEYEASQIESLGIRRVSIRTAIVLGPGGGMMSKLVPLFIWGLGGRLGNGRQWFSWIHIDDLVNSYYQAIMNRELSGPMNASAPEPITNRQFTKELAQALHRPAFWIVPAWILRIILGEFARAVLGSTRVVPTKLLGQGFVFNYPTIGEAFRGMFK